MDFTILVNKDNLLPRSYVPKNLIATDNNENNFHKYFDTNLKPMICKDIYPFYLKMKQDALKKGINLTVGSGYRSYDYQQIIWDHYVEAKGLEEAKKFVAIPGSSEHQTGLAFDVAFIRNNEYSLIASETDPEIKWLLKNAYKYGFILRYPKDKENITGYSYEPWHYRFVGIELAKILYKNNLTLEEYYQRNNTVKKVKNH